MADPDHVPHSDSTPNMEPGSDVTAGMGRDQLKPLLEAAQLEKLRLEIQQLKESRAGWLGEIVPWITASLAFAALIIQLVTTKTALKDNFEKEYWSRQLVQYEAAIELASRLSTEEVGTL